MTEFYSNPGRTYITYDRAVKRAVEELSLENNHIKFSIVAMTVSTRDGGTTAVRFGIAVFLSEGQMYQMRAMVEDGCAVHRA